MAAVVTAVVLAAAVATGIRAVLLLGGGRADTGWAGLVLEALMTGIVVAALVAGHGGYAWLVLGSSAVYLTVVFINPSAVAREVGHARRSAGWYTVSEAEALVWQAVADYTRRRAADPALDGATAPELAACLTCEFTSHAADAAGEEAHRHA